MTEWSAHLSTAYQEIPVCVDAVSQASDEEREVGGGEEEGGDGDKHHPALQERHGHIGGSDQDPYQSTKKLRIETNTKHISFYSIYWNSAP